LTASWCPSGSRTSNRSCCNCCQCPEAAHTVGWQLTDVMSVILAAFLLQTRWLIRLGMLPWYFAQV
jgi:hypothetical protein